MNFNKTDTYTLVKLTEESVTDFVANFKENYAQIADDNLIIDFSEKINTEIKDLLLLLKISSKHRTNGLSFVIICTGIEIDAIPEELNVVPTFTEALDILEMDAIERDLGF
ncbi:ribonuclease Z [Lutibacter sp.]|uniref:ribonuclease Z n=1 Tax=Lutibacter sp. TaxID=1925666 RepID=UPI003561A1C0